MLTSCLSNSARSAAGSGKRYTLIGPLSYKVRRLASPTRSCTKLA
jgi:hypothetical protein